MKTKASLARKKKPINTTSHPAYVIEKVACCLLPDILTSFESEEGQKEFEEWKTLQEAMKKKPYKASLQKTN